MPTATKHTRKSSVHHRKRTGRHHKHSNHYLKVYWPYAPITIIVALGLFIGNWHPRSHDSVLAYATEMSINSLLTSTNQQRSANKKDALQLNPQLTAAAQAKADDMAARNYWSHTTPDGKEPWVFVRDSGYQYQKAGENLAYGFDSSQDTVTGWMNSKSHRENMLDGNYTEVGFGFSNAKNYNKSGPETVVVAMYGKPTTEGMAHATASANALPGLTTPTANTQIFAQESQARNVARISLLTNAQLPWATFAVGLTSGALLVIVILKHGIAARKLIVEGEEFVIRHPFLDITLVALVMVGYVLSQSAGVIR